MELHLLWLARSRRLRGLPLDASGSSSASSALVPATTSSLVGTHVAQINPKNVVLVSYANPKMCMVALEYWLVVFRLNWARFMGCESPCSIQIKFAPFLARRGCRICCCFRRPYLNDKSFVSTSFCCSNSIRCRSTNGSQSS